MRYAIRANNDGIVTYISSLNEPREGDLTVDALPEKPADERGYMHELRVVDGALVWARVAIEEPAEQEPAEPPEPTSPTHEEIEAARAAAYRATVDPITCEIQRLRDMCGSAQEIAEAEARREAEVAAIKAQYPYPEDEVSTVDSSRL